MKRLKAYDVRDGDDGCCIVFATNSATARREGANELNTDWEGIDTCRRESALDEYAPGPVPPLALIELGWWFECHHCGRKISETMHEEVEDDDLDPANFDIVTEGQAVFCSHSCSAIHHAERRANKAAEVALIELFETKFADCAIKRVHVHGQRLEAPDKHGGMKCTVAFMFPGAKHGATWEFGNPDLYVAFGDHPAYYAWRGITPPAAATGISP